MYNTLLYGTSSSGQTLATLLRRKISQLATRLTQLNIKTLPSSKSKSSSCCFTNLQHKSLAGLDSTTRFYTLSLLGFNSCQIFIDLYVQISTKYCSQSAKSQWFLYFLQRVVSTRSLMGIFWRLPAVARCANGMCKLRACWA